MLCVEEVNLLSIALHKIDLNVAFGWYPFINSLVSGRFRGFSKKKRINARGFAWEFLRYALQTW